MPTENPFDRSPEESELEETLPRSGVSPKRKTVAEQPDSAVLRPGGDRGTRVVEGGWIGKYQLERKLGQGGMGIVWLGHHPELDIPVAIKTLPTFLVTRDPSFVDRFLKEARTAARLNHPNIVRIYDAGKDDDVYYLVMEFVEGGTVLDLLREQNGPLPLDKAIHIIRCVAEALAAASEFNIIHRDIKPENILLDSKGVPKLSDLGLAKQLDSEESMTGTGMAVGTPSYMAPEQIQDAKSCDARADIYALGATFYHLVTGKIPFEGSSTFDLMLKHIQEPLPPPRSRNPNIPEEIEAIITKMMAKSPDDRFQSARELIEALDRFQGTGKKQHPSSATGGKRRLAVFSAASLILLAALGYGLWEKISHSSPPAPAPGPKVVTQSPSTASPEAAGEPTQPPSLEKQPQPAVTGNGTDRQQSGTPAASSSGQSGTSTEKTTSSQEESVSQQPSQPPAQPPGTPATSAVSAMPVPKISMPSRVPPNIPVLGPPEPLRR
ncbi:MAG: serine/threonine protein kinase [Lentisphaerae bacterium]|nr:MAG: serine/threonine protein kinase [Lentisphaerota bacterium]